MLASRSLTDANMTTVHRAWRRLDGNVTCRLASFPVSQSRTLLNLMTRRIMMSRASPYFSARNILAQKKFTQPSAGCEFKMSTSFDSGWNHVIYKIQRHGVLLSKYEVYVTPRTSNNIKIIVLEQYSTVDAQSKAMFLMTALFTPFDAGTWFN